MSAGSRAPRTVHVERLGYALHAGDFVHVKEERGRDRGELKVYRIIKFSADSRHLLGEYWEQPRFEGSSLLEHSFDTDGYDGANLDHSRAPARRQAPRQARNDTLVG